MKTERKTKQIIRRRNHKHLFVFLSTILAVTATITFIMQSNQSESVSAYSLEKFDPGFIISDYVMGKYDSMTEAEIQEFLTSKNACENRDHEYYELLSAKGDYYHWHWKDDHFVCLSEELFGDGEIIGEGETAAHIIWQAAQDFQVNPKVLLVLLQKETSLITDPIPNDKDYRKATGYGCPDTAACSEKYYGFKNQVRNAADLFHTVLTGGWTNYPLGENYVQYNPNAGCGGSMVDIRSLATSALYRYTPYQPNPGAIAAGYGQAECGAYGNRNFYLIYGDWFGDPQELPLESIVVPPTNDDGENNPADDNTGDEQNEPVLEEQTPETPIIEEKNQAEKQAVGAVYDQYKIFLGAANGEFQNNEATGIFYQQYEDGYIVGNTEKGFYVSTGRIREVWQRSGFESGELGFPTGNIGSNDATGIKWQTYEHGLIVGNDNVGYYISKGRIRDTWQQFGFESGELGFPTGNIGSNDATGIKWQTYEHGLIVGNDNVGYYISKGRIRDTWQQFGFESGELGFPTGNIGYNNVSSWQEYQRGRIVCMNTCWRE